MLLQCLGYVPAPLHCLQSTPAHRNYTRQHTLEIGRKARQRGWAGKCNSLLVPATANNGQHHHTLRGSNHRNRTAGGAAAAAASAAGTAGAGAGTGAAGGFDIVSSTTTCCLIVGIAVMAVVLASKVCLLPCDCKLIVPSIHIQLDPCVQCYINIDGYRYVSKVVIVAGIVCARVTQA